MDDNYKAESRSSRELPHSAKDRRQFLRFLAASPCLAAVGGMGGIGALLKAGGVLDAQDTSDISGAGGGSNISATPGSTQRDIIDWEGDPIPNPALVGVIPNPAAALNVFDFEEAAHRKVMQGHWAFMMSGVDSDATLRANRDGFNHILLRPRRLRDVSKLDTKVNLFGTVYNSPIFTSPTGGERSMNPDGDGELSVARAAKARNAPQYLSTTASASVEDVNKALGRPCWYQLYAPNIWAACEKLLHRVEASGCTVITLTVDGAGGRNSETFLRTRPADLTECKACHEGTTAPTVSQRPMLANLQDITGPTHPLDWNYVDMIRKTWKGKFLLKGILTREDTRLAIEHGVDGIHVSNHGGRATETNESTIQTLPEIVAEARGRVPVLVDGGFRRGTDVFKALALGATAVGIGRPMLWGLGSFGQEGVDKVLEIMQRELKLVMGNCGTLTVAGITKDYVNLPSNWKT